ncbi:MAG: 3-keto-5-aminohexanoate cleavage protein [Anaerolineales bacterium]|nr:3-keto-5-aminohexanoate cleavage protein [Anaerolineales bacterium]MCB0011607.1 3-keto-5-aminohexanoate cleavage protein [Anaerolineales bacterium]MCB0018867.1 3-keto-5-aminohexanoate cleavage protein [Anaerolineales bacterium]
MLTLKGKVIITCALTGGIHGKEANPRLPEQPDEIIEQGIAAWKAGAAILHVHARNPDGSNSMSTEIFDYLHRTLCAETDAVVQLTTGGSPVLPVKARLNTIGLRPEMCSLNMGILNFFIRGERVFFSNHREDIDEFAATMKRLGVKPELEVYSLVMLEEVERLLTTGLLEPPYMINLVMHTPTQGGMRGTPENLVEAVRRLPHDAYCNVSSMGRTQLPISTMAMAMGCQVRVGMEDNVYFRYGELVEENSQLVARTVRIARELELQPAEPAEVREILGLRGRAAGELPA